MPQAVFVPAQLNDLAVDVALSGVARGDVLYRGATKWNNLPAGASGQFLKTLGAGADPTWSGLAASDLAPAVILAPTTAARNLIDNGANDIPGLRVRGSPTQSDGIFQVESSGGVGLLTIGTTTICNTQPVSGTQVSYQAKDDVGNIRMNILSSGLTTFSAIPATAGAQSNNSPTFRFDSTRWTGSASAIEPFRMLAQRSGSSANAVSFTLTDNGNVGVLSVAGTGGEVGINYANASSGALTTLGQLFVLVGAATSLGLVVRAAASQSAKIFALQSSAAADWLSVAAGGLTTITLADATTNVISDALIISHTTSGTAAAGFGQQLRFKSQSSTGANRNVGLLSSAWVVATDASRTSRMRAWASDAVADRECIRWETDGTNAMVGFLGANATARVAITGSRGGNAALASLLTELASKGLITDSSSA